MMVLGFWLITIILKETAFAEWNHWKGKFDVRMDKADLSALTDPIVTISIQIGGYDFGEQNINMTDKDGKWEYKR